MKKIEIGGLIEEGMWNYGDSLTGKEKEVFAGPRIREMATVEKDGYSAHRMDFSILTGTYLETPAHLLADRFTIDQIPIEDLFLKATILKIPKEARGHVELKDLKEKKLKIEEGSALVIYTGYFTRWNTPGFFLDSPHFTPEAMDYIVSKKIKILAADMPCYDDPRDPEDSKNLPQLTKLYRHNIMALAPIVNGDKVEEGYGELIVLPLKVKGVSASPARAVLIIGG